MTQPNSNPAIVALERRRAEQAKERERQRQIQASDDAARPVPPTPADQTPPADPPPDDGHEVETPAPSHVDTPDQPPDESEVEDTPPEVSDDPLSTLIRGPKAARKPDAADDSDDDDTPPATGTVEEETRAWSSKERNIQNLVKIRRRLEAENKALKAKQGTGSSEETQQLRAQLDEALNQVAQLSLAHDPRFRARHAQAQKGPLDAARKMVLSLGGEESLVDEVKDKSMPDRLAVLKDQFPDTYQVVLMHLVDYDKAKSAMETELAQSAATREQLEAQREAELVAQQQQAVQQRNALTSQVLTALEAEGYELFTESEGNAQWNQIVGQIRQRAKALAVSNNPAMQMKGLALGAAASTYQSLWHRTLARLEEVESELTRLKRANPGTGGDETDEPTPGRRPKAPGADGLLGMMKAGKFRGGRVPV